MGDEKPSATYDAEFIGALIKRFHGYEVDGADATGLVGMLAPVDALAEAASSGVGFDDEPGDFQQVLHAESARATRGSSS